MSDEEHHFESKADAGASKTYPQQAGTIRKNGYIVIKGRPCKVVEVSTSKTGKHGHAKCHFVGIDIFTAKKLEDIVPSSHNCDVPHVNRTDYQLIDISEDGFVSLLTDNGNTKDDLRLPTDENLLSQIKDGFAEGKDLVVSVMSAMGEEQICALKDIGPKLILVNLMIASENPLTLVVQLDSSLSSKTSVLVLETREQVERLYPLSLLRSTVNNSTSSCSGCKGRARRWMTHLDGEGFLEEDG
ncbi:UNVERIFIED_CONTAM: Eukaryotic translation initiation factor 5A-2 [Sesamum indicum]